MSDALVDVEILLHVLEGFKDFTEDLQLMVFGDYKSERTNAMIKDRIAELLVIESKYVKIQDRLNSIRWE